MNKLKHILLFIFVLSLYECKKPDNIGKPGDKPYCIECYQVHVPSFKYNKCTTLDTCNIFEDSLNNIYGEDNITCVYYQSN